MKKFVAVCALLLLCVPFVVSAHEVYVLTPAEINSAVSMPSQNPFDAIPASQKIFLESGAIVLVFVLVTLRFSISQIFENVFDPMLMKLKRFAPLLGRITFGVALFASGYFRDFFGPELPMTSIFSAGMTHVVSILFMIGGICLVLGLFTRYIAFIMFGFFIGTVYHYKGYMLTYVNYLGEMVLTFILGSGMWSLDALFAKPATVSVLERIGRKVEPYSFLILRVCFGVAVFFASFYAKFLHSNLALDTVLDYHLTNYFHFAPLFVVLGAFIIEAILGLCFTFGFEIRLACIVYTFFLTISILFFGEVVWPHVILFGVNFALFCHGYDKYTVEMALFQRKKVGEPVL